MKAKALKEGADKYYTFYAWVNKAEKVGEEYQYGKLIAQSVSSEDVNRINQELIETLKFQFAAKPIFSGVSSVLAARLLIKSESGFGSGRTAR